MVVMFVTSFGMLFLAGARLGSSSVSSGWGLAVVTLIIVEPLPDAAGDLPDPGPDPFGSGYQLT